MRIHHHVSIILFVAIAGAVGLAVAVGMLLGKLERDARDAGKAGEQLVGMRAVLDAGRGLQKSVDALGPQASAEHFGELDGAFERSVLDLAKLRHGSLVSDEALVEDAVVALETLARQARELAGVREAGLIPETQLDQFRDGIGVYMKRLGKIERAATATATARDEVLDRGRKLMMITMGIICILYLAVIERVRQWTTRRLIHPVQRLADAAKQAMEGAEGVFPGLEQGSTEELNTLARVLSTFVDTLKAKVRERTEQIERQREHLEREVAVRRRAEDQLRHAAFHDKLTGLCNRDLLIDRLERCIERSRRHDDYRFAVLFLDIDRFKEVNDSLGHFVGDQLLVAIAERLQHCLRGTDFLSRVDSNTVARIGGDEFVVLLDGIRTRGDASQVAERVQEVLAEPFRLQGQEVFTSASIGIAFNEIECEKADHLLRDADTAMYYAKAAGKARHEVFNKKMHDEAISRLQLHNDMRRAVENDEFDVTFQPIISLKNGRLCGFEVLARWTHPERGPVSPIEFIAHAEETGLILQIGRSVLERGCRRLREWLDEGIGSPDLSVSVNVSKRQLVAPGMVDGVKRILADTRLTGRHLRLEITESVMMENPEFITEVLQRLKSLGIEIHMDDFGTGYSSLSFLHRFPLDVLKIDRAFMSMMSAESDYADVVHTVVAMAHTLNMKVIVEGVETREQLTQLMSLDCDFAQGYYFSAPVPAAAARAMIVQEPEWLKTAA